MYYVKIGNKEKKIEILEQSGTVFDVELDGKLYRVDFVKAENSYSLIVDGKSYEIDCNIAGNRYDIWIRGNYFPISVLTEAQKRLQLSKKKKGTGGPQIVETEMPGKIVSVKKNKGDTVKKGETVIVLEAMKMQNEILSPKDGTIEEIYVKDAQIVEASEKLFKVK